MEKADILRKKREDTRKRKKATRKDTLTIAYISKKYPFAYKEAEVFYTKLNQTNPTKNDLRKTEEFRKLKQVLPEQVQDGMLLQIPIETPLQNPVETPLQNPFETPLQNPFETPLQNPVETTVENPVQTTSQNPVETTLQNPVETALQDVPDDLQDIQDIFETYLSPDLVENLLKELREDIYIDQILNEGMNEVEIGLDNEINISCDDRLEEELATLL